MKTRNIYLPIIVLAVMALTSCGMDGDPGYCYIGIDYEYYHSNYGVYYYEDDNPDVPEWEYINTLVWYESYPGTYEYYYESEDPDYWYSYDGTYTLLQNYGSAGGILYDGLDGADTYYDLYLEIYAKKGLVKENADLLKAAGQTDVLSDQSERIQGEELAKVQHKGKRTVTEAPIEESTDSWTTTKGDFTLTVTQTMKKYAKQK